MFHPSSWWFTWSCFPMPIPYIVILINSIEKHMLSNLLRKSLRSMKYHITTLQAWTFNGVFICRILYCKCDKNVLPHPHTPLVLYPLKSTNDPFFKNKLSIVIKLQIEENSNIFYAIRLTTFFFCSNNNQENVVQHLFKMPNLKEKE